MTQQPSHSQSPARRLSIAVVSSGHASGLGGALVRGFEQGGHSATLVPEPTIRVKRLARAALEVGAKLPDRCVTSSETFASLARLSPDLVVVIKGGFVSAASVQRMRERSYVVCWNPDSPFDSAASNRGGMVHSAMPTYDAYVTWSTRIANAISDRRDNVFRIPFGVDPSATIQPNGPEAADGRIVFIGTATPERVALIDRLRGLDPVVFGNGWANSYCQVFPAVYGAEMLNVASKAAWCLNPLRPQNRDSHNMRTFELMACDAPQLTFTTDDHIDFLGGTRSRLCDSVEELISIASEGSPPRVDFDSTQHQYRFRCQQLIDMVFQRNHSTGRIAQ